MTGLLVEKRVLKYLLDLKFPKLASHLGKLQLDVELITIRWLLCCFVSVLPLDVTIRFYKLMTYKGAARVLDLVIYEGSKMLHKLALGVFKLNEKAILKLDDFNDTFVYLQEMTQKTDCDQIIRVGFLISRFKMFKAAFEIKIPKRKINSIRGIYLPKAMRYTISLTFEILGSG
jgi:hypothetical protein